jgi:protein-S-isoprenylcysteine O-methyltransferase Ste14
MKFLECKIPPVVVFVVCAAMMWWINMFTGEIGLDRAVRLTLGISLLLAGFVLGVASLAHFRKVRTTIHPNHPGNARSLVCGGVYRFTRNPMYLALLLALLAWSCFLDNVWTLLVGALFVSFMNRFQIQPEERVLESLFGDEFTAYKQRVRRWV